MPKIIIRQGRKLVAALIAASALLCFSNLFLLGNIWKKFSSEIPKSALFHPTAHSSKRSKHNVHVVVSHCDQPIDWIWTHFDNEKRNTRQPEYVLKSVSIMSKCKVNIPLSDLPQTQNLVGYEDAEPLIQVISLPNIGRCDHSYAYWIKEVLLGTKAASNDGDSKPNQKPPIYNILYRNHKHDGNPFHNIAKSISQTDLVLFMKDNDNAYRLDRFYDGLSDVLDVLTEQDQPSTAASTSYSSLKQSNFSRPINWGMACQSYPNLDHVPPRHRWRNKLTNLCHRSILWEYAQEDYIRLERDRKDADNFNANFRPMRSWMLHLPEYMDQKAELQTLFSTDYYNLVIKDMLDQEKDSYFFTVKDLFLLGPRYYYRMSRDDKFTLHYRYTKTDLVPVCYGGVFATFWGQINSPDSPLTWEGWSAITQSLSRADNVEEGTFNFLTKLRFIFIVATDTYSFVVILCLRCNIMKPLTHVRNKFSLCIFLVWTSLRWSCAGCQNLEGHYMERLWADIFSWSSWAKKRSIESLSNATAATSDLSEQENFFSGKGVSLREKEQLLLLGDKLRHFPPNNDFAGVVILDTMKIWWSK